MVTKVKLVTPNADSAMDEVNDSVRVSVVSGSGGGMSDAEFAAHLPLPVSDNGGSLTVDAANLDVALSTRLKAADTLNAVTSLGSITSVVHVDDNSGSLTVDGLVTAVQATGTNLHMVVDSGTVSTITNVVHVDDNAGSLTVDGTVTSNQGGAPWTVKPDGTVWALTSTSANVNVTNAVSIAAAQKVGLNDTIIDNAAFADGTDKVLLAGYIFDEVAGTALTENDAAAARVDSKRAQVSVIEGATRGTRADVKTTSAVAGDPSLFVDIRPGNVFAAPITINTSGNTRPSTATIVPNMSNLSNGGPAVTGLDPEYNNWNTTTGDAGSKTVTFAGATQTNFDAAGAIITVKLGVVSGTTPTLSCQLQYSYDAGTTWLSLGAVLANLTATNNTGVIICYPGAIVGTATGATATIVSSMCLPRTWRLNYTIGGTTPNFAITAVYVNYVK